MNKGILNWDSDFFGYKVAFINIKNEDEAYVAEEIKSLQNKGCKLIYVISNQILDLKDYDVVLVDTKRSYILNNPKFKEIDNPIVPIAHPEELYELAYQAGEYSRFRVDPHFSDNEFKKLYRIWIDNSINKGFADYVFASVHNGKPSGFITAKIKEDEISIGLIAVDDSCRGKGIGSSLIQKVINIASRKGLQVEVTTQATNTVACAFYEKFGFVENQQDYIYHVWSK